MSNSQNELSWSKWTKTPTEKYLESIGYYNKFIEVWEEPNELGWMGGFIRLPQGISGSDLISIRKALSADYKQLEGKNDPIIEAQKTGAAIGYDWMKKNKKN